ncbi:MAG TPA: polysaccharide biosynthesis/export family protein [Puia sp.]|nr:polysaccharide biosynthesis/export family protein [Puia sp.]
MKDNPSGMMQIFFSRLKLLFVYGSGLTILAIAISSCGNTRQLVYMQGKFDTAKLSQISLAEPVIQKGDLLSIIVYSDNPGATAIYNQSVIIANSSSIGGGGNNPGGGTGSTSGAQSGVGSPTVPGYLVDEDGNIQFQGLGVLHIEGLTKAKLKALLDSKLKEFLNNPYYSVRFLNYRFTMLGEVTKPGVFTIPGERISLLDALGLAGDLTFYGRRDNVLVIRENNGKREFARLDLTKPEILASPYYYLQQSDVVVVEPTKRKIAANDQVTARNITIGATVISTLALIYSIFKK